ncbi:hypothetical protein ACLOJK_040727 [Asimina triloba]
MRRSEMDHENGVALERENGVIEKAPLVDGLSLSMDKVSEDVGNGLESVQVNSVPEDSSNIGTVSSAGAEDAASSATVSDCKSSNTLKKPIVERADRSKYDKKLPKTDAAWKGQTVIPPNKRNLSQSVSFPSRGPFASSLRKSTDEKQMKSNGKNSFVNDAETASVVSNGSLTSTSRSNISNRRNSAGLSSMDAKMGGASTRRTTWSSILGSSQSLSMKSGSSSTNINGSASEVPESCDQSGKTSIQELPLKDDEDAHSTTSNATRRSSSGFASRLNERAERRKEFFSKLEEKIHEKEVEKNNQQAKSKESQEAEIKQLRKSLTFKATPMPSFYQEPAPKVELKKIPTTRPKSPKFGRHKPSLIATSNLNLDTVKSNGGGTTNGNGDTTTAKKLARRSLSKPPSQKSTATKTEAKPLNSKSKTANEEPKAAKVPTEEIANKPMEKAETETQAIAKPDMIQNAIQDGENVVSVLLNAEEDNSKMGNLSDLMSMPGNVSVVG